MQQFPTESTTFLIQGPSGDLEVSVDWPKTDEIQPITFVMCHPNPVDGGTMNNKVVTTACSAMTRLGIPCVRFNYRGVGLSEGKFGETIGETEDLQAVLEWVTVMRPAPLWLGGFSFGTLLAYRKSTEWPIEQLLTIGPAFDHYDYSVEAVPDMSWLMIIGDQDEVVSVEAAFDFVRTVEANLTLYKMHGVGHFFHRKLIDLREYLMHHYQECLLCRN